MSNELFEDWIIKLDRQFHNQVRKIVLLIDNCPTHLHVENLINVNLIFYLLTLPLDEEVMRSLKVPFRRSILILCIKGLQNMSLPKITILEAMKILSSSWSEISAQTIINFLERL